MVCLPKTELAFPPIPPKSFNLSRCSDCTWFSDILRGWHEKKSHYFIRNQPLKVKLLPKSNLGFICESIWVKTLCNCAKAALLRFTVVLFSGKLIFNGVLGHSYASIKITIFKTPRGLDTTWNFARSITRVSTHEHEHWEHCLCIQSLLKRRFLNNLAAVFSVCCCDGRQKVLIPECDLTGRRVMVDRSSSLKTEGNCGQCSRVGLGVLTFFFVCSPLNG